MPDPAIALIVSTAGLMVFGVASWLCLRSGRTSLGLRNIGACCAVLAGAFGLVFGIELLTNIFRPTSG